MSTVPGLASQLEPDHDGYRRGADGHKLPRPVSTIGNRPRRQAEQQRRQHARRQDQANPERTAARLQRQPRVAVRSIPVAPPTSGSSTTASERPSS
jgi:hypothetical protein